MNSNLNSNSAKEINEAIEAGKRVLNSLDQAENYLQSASNWGIVDIFGGGFLTDIIKHSKINKAQSFMQQIQFEMSVFQKELGDIQLQINLDVDISGTLCLFDFFFDNVFADFMVQGKINEALDKVSRLRSSVQQILDDLVTHLD